ncbi:Hsp70 family protein [Skermania piniformis]|uniref:Hsp70 family protein n=1 Tax=Skermania pinensis TaxID=39122 RepID=A0ABX8SCF2_9ACTN|nr:Hsp70 family protein [Skermania piniformis]QXQ14642.1 Hsp70 family protein [Skermania piniformis]
MRTSLGVSAGTEVVCAALLTTTSGGDRASEYRVLVADETTTDLGALIASSINMMTTLSRPPVEPTGIAIAYRTKEQTDGIRSAMSTQRREVRLVPESAAVNTYLQQSGHISRYRTIAVADLGASGLTVTVLDPSDGAVLGCQRTELVSGGAIDQLLLRELQHHHAAADPSIREPRGNLVDRARNAKEHLSTHNAVTLDHVAGRPLQMTRGDFEWLIADQIRQAAGFTRAVCDRTSRQPELIVLIGGGANIPALRSGLSNQLGVRTVVIDEPEAVIAKGAALIADAPPSPTYPIVSLAPEAPKTFPKVAGMVAGALLAAALIVGYGVQALRAPSNSVSPAGTNNEQSFEVPTSTGVPPATLSETSSPGPTTPSPRSQLPGPSPGGEPVLPTAPTAGSSSEPPTLRPGPGLSDLPWPGLLPPTPPTGG